MALDWNKELSLSTILDLARPGRRGSQGSSAYPSKTTMNLYQNDDKGSDLRLVALTAVLLTIAISAFVKVGVLDQLAALTAKENELARSQAAVAKASHLAKDYDELKDSYDGYLLSLGDGSADAMTVLAMVESRVMTRAEVSGIVISDNTLTLTLTATSLDLVGDLARDLRSQPLVKAVNVSTASTSKDDSEVTSATLVINLVGGASEED